MTPAAGSVAIVTGAATGIGRGIALALAAAGAVVVVNHLDTPELADAVVEQAISAFGRSDVLVANAAWAPTKPLADFTEVELDRIWAVNAMRSTTRARRRSSSSCGSSPTRWATARSPSTPSRRGQPRPRPTRPAAARNSSGASPQCRRSAVSGRSKTIADVVTFVALEQARWITGQVVRVNGGTV